MNSAPPWINLQVGRFHIPINLTWDAPYLTPFTRRVIFDLPDSLPDSPPLTKVNYLVTGKYIAKTSSACCFQVEANQPVTINRPMVVVSPYKI